ncbi:hypothetical protein C8Q79DRAFT_967013 [Trametes meyenii]|nr:hypothetical protein C8Q79DRAFT_967013 [Trametes meyenii]
MADTIRSPWILDYLISVAEKYGGDLAAVPQSSKTSKAQLVKFLTFAPPDSTEPCAIWADVSDKKNYIHARLSVDAIKAYMQNPRHAGASLTSRKSGLIKLTKFRPAFARVARRDGVRGMSDTSRLYLDVDEFELLGCFGEPMWGAPVDIAQDKDIHEWMLGLRQEGGAGNVLKLKKERTAALAAQQANKLQAMAAEPQQQTIDAMQYKVRVARKSASYKPRSSTDAVVSRPIASKDAVRRSSWKQLRANMIKYIRPPDDVFEQLMALCGVPLDVTPKSDAAHSPEEHAESPQLSSQARARLSPRASVPARTPSPSPTHRSLATRIPSPSQTGYSSAAHTPSHWSPSVVGSPPREHEDEDSSSDTEEEPEVDVFMNTHDVTIEDAMEVDIPFSASGYKPPQSMPPPAQPQTQLPSSSLRSVPYATSPWPSRGSPPLVDEDARDIEALPPSSFPMSSYVLPPSPASSPRFVPATPAYPIPAVRRVPLPQCNPLRRDPDASGEGRILVENSDTASPGSQRFIQSQSQSQSQTGSHETSQHSGDGSQQSQRPSQLRNQLEPECPSKDPPVRMIEGGTQADDNGEERAGAEEPDHEHEQIRPRSQQSLSYKGDSQSQGDPPDQVPAPAVGNKQNEHRPVDDANVPPAEEAPVAAGSSAPDPGTSEEHSAERERDRPSAEPSATDGPKPSPMVVDLDKNSPSDTIPSTQPAPGWAAIVVVDDSNDDSEVDELLSDPLVTSLPAAQPVQKQHDNEGVPSTSHGRTTSLAEKTKSGKVRLESDDERTAGMVDEYMEKLLKLIDTRKKLAAQDASPKRMYGHAALTGSDRVHNPRARKRQKMNRNEADGQQAGPSASARSTTHDPIVWSAPTFMRQTAAKEAATLAQRPSVEKVKTEGASPAMPPDASRDVKSHKRTKRLSPSPDREKSPAKKRKTSTSAVPVPAPVLVPPRPQKQPTPPRRDPTSSAIVRPLTSKAPPPISIVRSTASPNIGKAPEGKRDSAAPGSTVHPAATSTATRSSREVKYVDLRSASRSSSRASSRVSRSQEEQDASQMQNRPSSTQPSAEAKGKVVLRPPAPAESKETRSGAVAKSSLAGVSRVRGASASSAASGSKGGSQASSKASDVSSVDTGLLGGCSDSLGLTRTPGGPPLLGWDDLLEIVLKTGRARYKERQRGM